MINGALDQSPLPPLDATASVAPQESVMPPSSSLVRGSQPQQPKFDPFKEIVDAANSTFKPLEVAVLDSIANQSNNKASFEGALKSAKGGTPVAQYVQKIATAATLEQQLKSNQDAQNNLQIDPTDTTKVDEAMKVLKAEMAKVIPKPGVEAPHVDKEAMTIGAIAILLGAPPASVVIGLHNGATRVANQQNEANQQNYQDQVRQQDKNVADAKFVVNQEGDAVTAQERANINKYNTDVRSADNKVEDIQKAIQDRKELEQKDAESIQKRFDKDVDDAKKQIHQYYIDNGGWDKDGQKDGANLVAKLVGSIAAKHHDKNASMGENLKFISQLQNELDVYSPGTKTAKQQNSDRNFAFKVDKTKWDQEFKGKTFDQRQSMFDKKFEEQVRQFEQTMGRNLTNDEWRKAYQKGQQEIAIGRESRLQGMLDGGMKPAGIKPPTPSQKDKALKDIAELEKEMATFPSDPDKYTPAQKATSRRLDYLNTWLLEGDTSGLDPVIDGKNSNTGENVPPEKDAGLTGGIRNAVGNVKKAVKGSLPKASGTKDGKPVTVQPRTKSTPTTKAPAKTGTAKTSGGKIKSEGGAGYHK